MANRIMLKMNDQWIRLVGLKDGRTGQFVADALVSATLYDSTNKPVTGCSNITLLYAAELGNGTYIGLVDEVFNPLKGTYTLIIDCTSGGRRLHGSAKVRVLEREL